jgi:hypothetical protein
MSNLTVKALVLALSSLAVATEACTLASPTTVKFEPSTNLDSTDNATMDGGMSGSSSVSSGGAAAECASKFTKPDASQLTACGNGKGHCYPKDKMDAEVSQLYAVDTCAGANELCISDDVLEAGGGKLKSCSVAALDGKPGGCITIDLLPELKAQGSGALKQDVCDVGQVCAPCVDPIHQADTPFCHPIGVRDGSCGAAAGGSSSSPAKAPEVTCCSGDGVCIPSAAVPADDQSMVIQDTCAGDNKCAPKALVDGKPVVCDGGLLGDGVCIPTCFSHALGIAGDIGALSQATCGANQLCIPCKLASLEAGSTPIPGCAN